MELITSTPLLPALPATAIADEVLVDAVAGTCHCPNCGAPSRKAVFADGDTERCSHCAEELWFELRGDSAVAHRVHQSGQGSSLSELMRSRQLR